MIPKIPFMKISGIFSYFATFLGLSALIFRIFVSILHFNNKNGDLYAKKEYFNDDFTKFSLGNS